jgi:hypothetical protein
MSFDLERFPAVPKQYRPRELVFDTLSEDEIKELRKRGYDVTLLRWLPRRNDTEAALFVQKFMMGLLDGTLVVTKARLEGLHYELQTRGFLGKDGVNWAAVVKDEVKDESVAAILGWGETRHKIGASTMMEPERMKKFMDMVRKEGKK